MGQSDQAGDAFQVVEVEFIFPEIEGRSHRFARFRVLLVWFWVGMFAHDWFPGVNAVKSTEVSRNRRKF